MTPLHVGNCVTRRHGITHGNSVSCNCCSKLVQAAVRSAVVCNSQSRGRGGSVSGRGGQGCHSSGQNSPDRFPAKQQSDTGAGWLSNRLKGTGGSSNSGRGRSGRGRGSDSRQPVRGRSSSSSSSSGRYSPINSTGASNGGRQSVADRRSGSGNRSRRAAATDAAGEFVVIGKASDDVGSYISDLSQLEAKEGGSFWEAAFADEDEGEAAAYGSDNDDMLEGDEDEEVAVEEMANLLRELAEDLDDAENAEGDTGAQSGTWAGASQACWRAVYTSRQPPDLQLGSVTLRTAAGMGRGIFTTARVAAGDLLMVAAPLVLLYCEEGTTPEIEELADRLTAAVAATISSGRSGGSSSSVGGLAVWQQHALLQLRSAGIAGDANPGQMPDLLQLIGSPADFAAGLQAASSGQQQLKQQQEREQQQQSSLAAPLMQPPTGTLPGPEEVLKLAFANSSGEEFEDPALTLLRGTTSCGQLGIWPAAAMINHACCPNAHAMLVGDRLVVRAATGLAAGEQVFLSYLGPQLFQPLQTRQQELHQVWGFKCNCNRCKAEVRYASSSSSSGSQVFQVLIDAHAACLDIAEVLDTVIDDEDLQKIAELQQQLYWLQQQVEAALQAAKPPANVRRWLQASVYDLYDLLSLCADQLPAQSSSRDGSKRSSTSADSVPVETEALAACARIVGAIIPGSNAHADLVTEYMVRAEARFGERHQEAVDALRMARDAHVVRYGRCSEGLLQLLMDTRAGAALL